MGNGILNAENLKNDVRGKKLFIVCGRTFLSSPCKKVIQDAAECVFFDGIMPNPEYEQILKGLACFRQSDCDTILAVGGGSVMDTAKCIKLFAGMPEGSVYYQNPFEDNGIALWAAPTTAGSGSEATQFAVIYVNGVKQSIDHSSIRPSRVYMMPEFLNTLPLGQRKATMLDALCHSVESVWSVNANAESEEYAAKALRMFWAAKDAYLSNDGEGNREMLAAAHLAGQAINITRTTACHAMSYKLTKKYGLPHGIAAALSLEGVWDFLERDFSERNRFVLDALGVEKGELFRYVDGLLQDARDSLPEIGKQDMDELVNSVDVNRLKNMPAGIARGDIEAIYANIRKDRDKNT